MDNVKVYTSSSTILENDIIMFPRIIPKGIMISIVIMMLSGN